MAMEYDFQIKNEFDDSNFSYSDYKDEERNEHNKLSDPLGELASIKTLSGDSISVYLRLGNKILFCSGKYFCIERTTAQTDHQKEYTGIVSTCHTCGVRIRGSLKVSSNFISHLKGRHPEVYQDFLKQKQESAHGTTVRRIHTNQKISPYPSYKGQNLDNNLQHESNDQFQRNVLQFLIATNQPLSLVEDTYFQRLFDFPSSIKKSIEYAQIISNECKYKQLELANFFSNSEVFISLTADAWSFGECKYIAVSSHWIDNHYQKQTALLTCLRSPINIDKQIDTIISDIVLRFGLRKNNIVSIVTENIQNYTFDFMEIGVDREALCFDYLGQTEDLMHLKQMLDNFNLIRIENNTELNVLQLDFHNIAKIWFIGFVKHMDDETKHFHQNLMDKCSLIWKQCHRLKFKENFGTLLNGDLIRPNFLCFTSFYKALKQLLINKNLLTQICTFLGISTFTNSELSYLDELTDIFEPLNAVFEFLDTPQNQYYGCFLPTLVTLKWRLTRLYNSKKLRYLQEPLYKLKELLLTEFKTYYELSDTKSEAIIAAITYPPVKTRFLAGLQERVSWGNLQAKNLLLKYGKDFHVDDEVPANSSTASSEQDNNLESVTAAKDFFDFGDGHENIDAEELRDVNISKKELSELVAELYDGLMSEGLSMESIDLETPRKFLQSFHDDKLNTPDNSPKRLDNNLNVSRQLDFNNTQDVTQNFENAPQAETTNATNTTNELNQKTMPYTQRECNQITSTNSAHDYSVQPDVMSIPSAGNLQTNSETMALIPIAHATNNGECPNNNNNTITINSSSLSTQLDLIAVPIPGKPNCFQLAKVMENSENVQSFLPALQQAPKSPVNSLQCSKTRGRSNANNYVYVKRNIIAEYIDKFKTLQNAQPNTNSGTITAESMDSTRQNSSTGFTQYQYDLMQQQLRIHIQLLTQTFVQTYCHPELWKLAPKPKEMLLELHEKAKENVNFQVWNLKPAVELIQSWQNELDQDTPENTALMDFLNHDNIVTLQRNQWIPRFHPRMLECYLNSPVFMYPQYLPTMPFSGRHSAPIFSPVEAYLIAMGLEKHLQLIYENKEKIVKSTPLRVACKRLAKDTLYGKRCKRIWDHIVNLQKVDYYNPIKYFFEHNKAPPVDHDPIWTFQNNVVLPPKDRIPELPLVFQKYLQKKNEQPKPKLNKKQRKKSKQKVSEVFKSSYIEFVKEVVGQEIPTQNLFYDPVESSDNNHTDTDTNNAFAEKRRKLSSQNTPAKRRKFPQSLTINVNYVYGNGLSTSSASPSLSALPTATYNIELSANNSSKNTANTNITTDTLNQSLINSSRATDSAIIDYNSSKNSLTDSAINATIDLTADHLNNSVINNDGSAITYNFDWRTKTLQPTFNTTQAAVNLPIISPSSNVLCSKDTAVANKENRKLKYFKKICKGFKLNKRIKQKSTAYREKCQLKRLCEDLITTYSSYLNEIIFKYRDYPIVQYYYRHFKALELYTCLLKGLKSFCSNQANNMSNASHNSTSNLKRARHSSNTDDDNSPASARQVRKLNRQEENFRHMILPETPEETNRKDAIYAFNFYEKVEEAFKAANKSEDCKKFNTILKTFDPKKDRVSDLYYKLEKLFLPDHPELAQVFLTFLLPAEAAEIGKFFEHFMINNMSTFINKLNIYFNKQPAQIRKVYNCLNDLAEDPDVTMKKVESKILPLLKGNQFLIDWFMQQFPQNTPPERLFSQPEQINLKDQQSNRFGECVETVTDLIDSPTNEGQQQQSCQLRYINGRIFYGSKMLLPAKLSFMAASYTDKFAADENAVTNTLHTCVHSIREHGEKRLQAAADLTAGHITTSDQDKSDDEEDVSKTLVIDTTADEEDSCSSMELCDEATLRAHAARLNPSVYTSCYSTANATSTPNIINNFHPHHANAKKTSLNFNEDGKISPRKCSYPYSLSLQANANSSLATTTSCSPVTTKEKRRSPCKKTKSPLNNNSIKTPRTTPVATQPMVVIHETNSAIQCAKRLKSLVEGEIQQIENAEEPIDSKEIMKIVAKPKNSLSTAEHTNVPAQICASVKEEELEFSAENSALSDSPFPCLRIETDSNEEDNVNSKTPLHTDAIATASDEDCKIEIVSSLTTDKESNSTPALHNKSQTILPLNAAWTRDEDKIILIEMKMGSQNRQELYQRISEKLCNRTMFEITSRHQFLMDFLSKLQGK